MVCELVSLIVPPLFALDSDENYILAGGLYLGYHPRDRS